MDQGSNMCRKLYGTATVGTKGQVVIPAEAREEMNIATGDRLYVIRSRDGACLGLIKEAALEGVLENLSSQIESFKALQKEDK